MAGRSIHPSGVNRGGWTDPLHNLASQVGKPLLPLYALNGPGLIILAPTGVAYLNQAGGYLCAQCVEEGAFVPLDLYAVGLLPELQRLLELVEHLTPDHADALDALLARFPTTQSIRVDRTRLDDSMEAWVYVDLPPDSR